MIQRKVKKNTECNAAVEGSISGECVSCIKVFDMERLKRNDKHLFLLAYMESYSSMSIGNVKGAKITKRSKDILKSKCIQFAILTGDEEFSVVLISKVGMVNKLKKDESLKTCQ
ncbi:MAG TPA: hypothetical protein VGO47_15150 [Chlamydiales bacterium]|jgi:hypothetical protein|nr:hypothetical protein [Chlamydiales bacterium]